MGTQPLRRLALIVSLVALVTALGGCGLFHTKTAAEQRSPCACNFTPVNTLG